MIFLLGQIILIVANIAMAKYHSHLMKEGKKIQHGYWGAVYLAFAGIMAFATQSWLLFICSLFIRKVVFDISLNRFNNRKCFFVSTETTSIIDKMHYKIFKEKAVIYYTIYSLTIIAINILK